MAQVIGLGGVFIKFNDPAKMRDWYSKVLGMITNDYGVLFRFNESQDKGSLQLGTFDINSSYFGSAEQQCMLNFRVDDLDQFIIVLKENNVKVLDEVESYSYGKFLHIEDPEGNKIELWEPIDGEFDAETSMIMR